ncbi:MAG: hypothetical protein ABIO45_15360 [Burkholderiaceae bacterium]
MAWLSALRSPERESDARLGESARRWLERIPAHARPVLLAARYPRIVNRIAALRGDLLPTLDCLDALLVDGRGGRIGFVPMIRAEIVRLGYLYRASLGESAHSSLWANMARPRNERPPAWGAPTRSAAPQVEAPRRAA